MPTALVIGSGFAGLSAATTLASKGWQVTVMEKNDEVGGRARTWERNGYHFDLGPSFYWMPEVFERYFARFGRKVADLYDLRRLDPSYSVVFGERDRMPLPAGLPALTAQFDSIEAGAGAALVRFLDEARVKYDLGINEFVYKPSLNWSEYLNGRVVSGMLRTHALRSLRRHVNRYFRDDRLRQIMEFPVLFLGAAPQHTPALYSLMNYADMGLGTWYPMGGMGRVVDALRSVAEDMGVAIKTGVAVERIDVAQGRAMGVIANGMRYGADAVVAAADYHHVEQDLLPEEHRSYSAGYWNNRVMAPSVLMFFLGIDRRLPGLDHHTLFFDRPFDQHSHEIYTAPRWPKAPLFYTSCTSKTDPTVAPAGGESLTILIPIAAGLEDTEGTREHYYGMVMERIEREVGFEIRAHVKVKRSYSVRDLIADHNSFRGNAYGLANTLAQTGPLRPKVKSRKVKGLYFAGQLTVPGPGVPPALISGQLVADLIDREQHERK